MTEILGAGRACFAAALLAMTGAAAPAAPSVCADVAAQARKLPDSAWRAREPLAPWMQRAEPRHPNAALTDVERELLENPRWRQALGAPAGEPLAIERLPGTPVYRVDHVSGSAGCQSYVLVQMRPTQAPRALDTPIRVTHPMGLCTTQSAYFATVAGQPALVVGGADSMRELDQRYRIAAWDGQRWAPACSLELRLRGELRPTLQRCSGDAEWCAAAAATARRVAEAYAQDRQGGARLDPLALTQGHEPDRFLGAALQQPDAAPGAAGDPGLELPLLGEPARERDPFLSRYAQQDVRRLPLWLEGRWWMAVVGSAGIGWRESTSTLVTLYGPLGRAVDAQAAYRFTLEPAGLAAVNATP